MSPERHPYNVSTWRDSRTLTDTPNSGEWRCPYCGTSMPDGVDDPSAWAHCGEVGHAEHWHLEWTPRNGMGASRWVKSDSDARYGEE